MGFVLIIRSYFLIINESSSAASPPFSSSTSSSDLDDIFFEPNFGSGSLFICISSSG